MLQGYSLSLGEIVNDMFWYHLIFDFTTLVSAINIITIIVTWPPIYTKSFQWAKLTDKQRWIYYFADIWHYFCESLFSIILRQFHSLFKRQNLYWICVLPNMMLETIAVTFSQLSIGISSQNISAFYSSWLFWEILKILRILYTTYVSFFNVFFLVAPPPPTPKNYFSYFIYHPLCDMHCTVKGADTHFDKPSSSRAFIISQYRVF